MSSSDAFFLGHQQGLNSGVLSLAASYGKPVVFPDLGNFREQLEGWPWCESYKAGDIESAVHAVKTMRDRLADYAPGEIRFDNTRWAALNSWDVHVERILEALESET